MTQKTNNNTGQINYLAIITVLVLVVIISLFLNLILIFNKNGVLTTPSAKQPQTIINNNYPLLDQCLGVSKYKTTDERMTNQVIIYDNLLPAVRKITDDSAYDKFKIGFYLEDLSTGANLGVNHDEKFVPASLIKVPVMIAVLKEADSGNLSLKDQEKLQKEDLNDLAGTLYKKGEGYMATIEELINEMITNSDNTAMNVLYRIIGKEKINKILSYVNLPLVEEIINQSGNLHVFSPKRYVRLFRILYYSTYLSEKYSQYALDLLTKINDDVYISAGLPKDIMAARKYGEYSVQINNLNLVTYSDCGIIYHPKSPFMICVMVQGDRDYTIASKIIGDLTRTAYNYVTDYNVK